METVKVWAYSLNACYEVVECLEAMEDKSRTVNMHKDEKKSRISHNQIDRDIVRKKLEVSSYRDANIEQIKVGRTYVSDLLNLVSQS